MTIAYLIAAHKDPQHLRRLIEALRDTLRVHVYFFIHLDQKVGIRPFVELCSGDDIVFIKNRFNVHWGAWSQFKYQRELLKNAIAFESRGVRFDRFVFLSGQDYPILSNALMVNEYARSPHSEYIKGLNITQHDIPRHSWVTQYHFFRDLRVHPFFLRVLRCCARNVMALMPFRKKPYIVFPDGHQWDVWHASAYMSITHDAAMYMAKYMYDDTICKYFRYCLCPDELVAPTIIFNSPYKDNAFLADNRSKYLIDISQMMHFDYSNGIKVWTEPDISELLISRKWFARKFVTGASDSILRELDEVRNRNVK